MTDHVRKYCDEPIWKQRTYLEKKLQSRKVGNSVREEKKKLIIYLFKHPQ